MVILALKCALLSVIGTFCFDCVHYILHVFEHSRFRVLRLLGGLHAVHHEFLDREMKIHRRYRAKNLFLHVIPEYGTAVVGMALFSFLFFDWVVGAIVIGVRTVLVVVYLVQKGEDFTHAETKRIAAKRSLIWVGPNYHALHHVYPRQYYSSFVNIFDMIFGTNCQIEGRRFLVTGGRGAFGSAMVEALKARGAVVETAVSGVDFTAKDCAPMKSKLERADVLVLAHGAKGEAAWSANYGISVQLIDMFRDLGRQRLVPPEVWGLGSEAELHSDFGKDAFRAYLVSKRAFARRARYYYSAPDVTYRHIVPSAFSSGLGPGLISAKTAVRISLFFIKRGFHYIPVTYTSLAFWNYFKFLMLPKEVVPQTEPVLALRSVR